MSEPVRALLVGATGLIGRAVIARAGELSEFALIGLARNEMQFASGTKAELLLAPSEDWAEAIAAIAPQVVINALGTTRRKAGSAEAFRRIDHDLVLDVAKAAKAAGAAQFVHVSAVGADPHARALYSRVKGETERALMAIGFRRLDIFQPSLLRGTRVDDPRFFERLAALVSPLADLLLHGKARRFRSILASDVAAAALAAAREKAAGTFTHEHDAMHRLAARLPEG